MPSSSFCFSNWIFLFFSFNSWILSDICLFLKFSFPFAFSSSFSFLAASKYCKIIIKSFSGFPEVFQNLMPFPCLPGRPGLIATLIEQYRTHSQTAWFSLLPSSNYSCFPGIIHTLLISIFHLAKNFFELQ